MPQARSAEAEVLVVSDGADLATAAAAEHYGATLLSLEQPRGANAARNAGIRAARSDLVVFVDDDAEAHPTWLAALLGAADKTPDREVFGGPIHARLEGFHLRVCGRGCRAPITTLDLGPDDRDVPFVWAHNMALRRSAFERVGAFDEKLVGRDRWGDEAEWELRYKAQGGRIRYVAGAGLDHRRASDDATLRALAISNYRFGRSARRWDVRNRCAPPLRVELHRFAGGMYHAFRRRCAYGIVMAAHSAGRIREALAPATAPLGAGRDPHGGIGPGG